MIGTLIDYILMFTFYSFLGWMLETIFKSVAKKKFINSGFLTGPFCPIYGFGAILIIQSSRVLDSISLSSLFLNLFVAIILTTLLEYYTGLILEKLFKCKWWDYSDEFLNIRGRICLKYSIFWGVLAYLLIKVIHPLYSTVIPLIPLSVKYIFSVFIVLYFILDTMKSIDEIYSLRQILFTNYKSPLEQFSNKIMKYKRIYSAFPRLYFPSIGKVNQEIREVLNAKIEKIKIQIKDE